MSDEYKPVTANDNVQDEAKLDREAQERAAEAGVKSPAYVGYEEALKNYENRDDVETLEDRRARENGTDFRDARFVREGDTTGVITTQDTKGKKPTQNDKFNDK